MIGEDEKMVEAARRLRGAAQERRRRPIAS